MREAKIDGKRFRRSAGLSKPRGRLSRLLTNVGICATPVGYGRLQQFANHIILCIQSAGDCISHQQLQKFPAGMRICRLGAYNSVEVFSQKICERIKRVNIELSDPTLAKNVNAGGAGAIFICGYAGAGFSNAQCVTAGAAALQEAISASACSLGGNISPARIMGGLK